MAEIIRYCKKENELYGDNVFDVSRPHILSNPFTHIKDKKTLAKRVVKDRETAIKCYARYFDRMVKTDPKFQEEYDKIYEAYKNNDKIYLGCYCDLTEACHVDVLIDRLTKRLVKEKLMQIKNRRHERTQNSN